MIETILKEIENIKVSNKNTSHEENESIELS